MEAFSEELLSQLESKISFEIPVFGGIPVPTSVVVTWGIMIVLVLCSIIFVRNLEMMPKRTQNVIEIIVEWLSQFLEDILGKEGKRYIPYLSTVAIYIACANLIGLLGFTPPTKDLDVTAGLAIMSIILIEYAGIKAKGTKNWVRSFAEPMALIAPLNVLEVFIRPLSLCMRLFGNVLGAFVVMELIKMVLPFALPVPFSLYFDVFDGLIQAYVFVFLTSLFIQEAIEVEE